MGLLGISSHSQNFSNGLFLVHEGNFGTSNGDLSFYDEDNDSLYVGVYQNANPGEEGFDVLQDFKIHNDYAYFVSKSSSNEKIVVADASDFSLIESIDLNTAGPQSMTIISDSKAYVSCANAPNLRILDLENNEINSSVGSSIGGFYSQDYLSVYNEMAYIFMGNKLGVIDTELDSAYTEILLPDAQNTCAGMLIEGEDLFVLTNSGWSGDSARLYRIDLISNDVELNLDLSNLGKARLLQSDGSNLYFMVLGEVYQMGLDDDIAPNFSFASSSFTDTWGDLAYGKSFLVDPSSSSIYIGSAAEFSGESKYEVLDLEDGSPIDTDLESGGIILNQFLKNSGSVGVDEPSMADFNLYPNPAFDIVELVFEQEEDRLITIVDLSGKQVFQVNTSSMRQRLNLSEIPDGIYLVVIRTDEFKMVKKLVLNH